MAVDTTAPAAAKPRRRQSPTQKLAKAEHRKQRRQQVIAEQKRKPKMGRPPDYDPCFCDTVIELGQQGYSRARMAAHIGVSKQTLADWTETHPEFSDAFARATTFSQAFHEGTGTQNFAERNFNTPLFLGMMKSMFRDDYGDRSTNEVTGANGGPIQIDSATDREVARRVAFMLMRSQAQPAQIVDDEQHDPS